MDLTRKAALQIILWTDQCSTAFVELKDRLCSLPVLRIPDMSKPFEVITDASERGIGAVLTANIQWHILVVSYDQERADMLPPTGRVGRADFTSVSF